MSQVFTIKVECDNAAFATDADLIDELIHILRRITADIDLWADVRVQRAILDSNGNRVGSYGLKGRRK